MKKNTRCGGLELPQTRGSVSRAVDKSGVVRLVRSSCRGVSVLFSLGESVLPSTPNAYSTITRILIVPFFAGTTIRMPRIHIFLRQGGRDAMRLVVRSLSTHTAACRSRELCLWSPRPATLPTWHYSLACCGRNPATLPTWHYSLASSSARLLLWP